MRRAIPSWPNDVVKETQGSGLVRLRVAADGNAVSEYHCDGLIFYTDRFDVQSVRWRADHRPARQRYGHDPLPAHVW